MATISATANMVVNIVRPFMQMLYYLKVTKFSNKLNLAILHLMKLVHIKFSN